MFNRLTTIVFLVLTAALASPLLPAPKTFAAEPASAPSSVDGPGAEHGQPGAREPERATAPVTVLNRTIVVFRGPLYGYSPQDRASVVLERISGQIEKGIFGPVTLRSDSIGTIILNNGQIAFTITPGDLDVLSGQTMTQASEESVKSLGVALDEAREIRTTPILLKALIRMLLATVLFGAIIWAIRRLYRWLLVQVRVVLHPWLERIAAGSSVYLADIAMVVLRFIIGLTVWIAGLLAADLWLTYWLHLFPYTRPWSETMREQVLLALAALARSMIQAMPDLLVIIFIFLVTRLLVQTVKRFFAAVEAGQLQVDERYVDTARPTSRIIVAVLWLFAVVAAYPYIPGSGTDAFKGVSLFVGLLVSLGSTSVVGQAASGLILMYSRALKQGEYVRVGDTEGTVLSLGMLTTRIRLVKNEEISIPNGVMISTTTKNYSRLAREKKGLLYTTVTIGYDTPWRQVHAMLILAADRTEGLFREPRPFVLQTGLADFYVEYQLNAFIRNPEERIPVLAALHASIQDVFNEFGVQIMSPHYLGDPSQAKVVPRDRWHQPPAEPDAAGKQR